MLLPLSRIIPAVCAALLLFASAPTAVAQSGGRLAGRVLDSPGTMPKGVEGVTVVAVNQVSSRAYRAKTKGDGSYSLSLPAGAYRVRLDAPHRASFDAKTKYGPFAIARGEAVENIGVEPGRDTKLDIVIAPKDDTPAPSTPPPGKGDDGDPNGYAGSSSVKTEAPTRPDRVPVRDRWRVGFPEYQRYGGVSSGRDILFRRGGAFNPYDQSILKGDYPIFGQHVFMILSGTSFTAVQQQRTPIPSNPSSARPGSAEAFGKPEVLAFNQVFQLSLEMFSGDTTFKPRQWAIKLSHTFSVPNYVRAREQGVLNIDPRRGTTRTDWHFSFEEAFAEVKLEDVNANYDAVSVRVGIQPFVSDFRGFIYTDNNLGARVFGAFKNNQYQFNLAYFAQLEKDTNSGLNRFDRRRQNVYVANIFKQDFLAKGYTAQASFHFNDDRAGIEYDRNGFKVRPAVVGDARPHSVRVGYLGISGDGHVGRINLSNSYYFALGTDTHNPIAGKAKVADLDRVGPHVADDGGADLEAVAVVFDAAAVVVEVKAGLNG
ncbi:MAG TPA: carboxypeptidase-like regulatory domain-containing protein, partial [Pyrinomonadaceae bacterium]